MEIPEDRESHKIPLPKAIHIPKSTFALESDPYSARRMQRGKTRERNDAKWEAHKVHDLFEAMFHLP